MGNGSPSHIAGELLMLQTGIQIVHVPYKGGGPAVADTIGGQVPYIFVSMPAAMSHVKSGKLRPLAVTTAEALARRAGRPHRRRGARPARLRGRLVVRDVRPGRHAAADHRQRCSRRSRKRDAELPEVKQKLLDQGADAVGGTPAELDRVVKSELKKWEQLVRDAKIKVD